MENLQEQISQATRDFIATVQSLTAQHAAQHAGAVLQETFSSLGGSSRKTASSSTGARARGAKRGAEELEQLSKRFVQFVHENPGQRIEQINKQLGTTTAELALPIRKLLAEGTITSEGQKRSTTYFAGKGAAAAPSDEGEDKATSGKSGKKRSRSASKRSRSRSKKK